MDQTLDPKARPGRAPEGLADRVYRELLAQIIAGQWREGDRLSTEQALAEQFNTSRPTVREALSRLRADGIVTSRQGAGTFVVRRPDPDLPRFMPLESMSDLRRVLEFRAVVESGALGIDKARRRRQRRATALARFATGGISVTVIDHREVRALESKRAARAAWHPHRADLFCTRGQYATKP